MTCQLADIMGSRGLQLQRRIRDNHHGAQFALPLKIITGLLYQTLQALSRSQPKK
jgi:hypothetical protein